MLQAKWGWGLDLRSIFFLHAFMPIVLVLPLTYSLVDSKGYHGVRSLTTQLTALWRLVRRRTVWKPMAFVAWYGHTQPPNTMSFHGLFPLPLHDYRLR